MGLILFWRPLVPLPTGPTCQKVILTLNLERINALDVTPVRTNALAVAAERTNTLSVTPERTNTFTVTLEKTNTVTISEDCN